MSRLLSEIKTCDECCCKTDELYLNFHGIVLCVDCESEYAYRHNHYYELENLEMLEKMLEKKL